MTAYRSHGQLPDRILLGPGPSDVAARVLQALARPTIGHLDPEFLSLMDATCQKLRTVFRTENQLTLPVSGTGSAGMEACICNLVEPGDEVIMCVSGFFGDRMREIAQRYGAEVHLVESRWGEAIDADEVAQALQQFPQTKLVGIVHAETSTGVHQSLEKISEHVHAAGALFVVDAVASLGGTHVDVDGWQIDACYSGSQKCLSCPPGLAPVTFSEAATQRMDRRTTPVTSWYLDMSMLRQYWGTDRVYHHTAPINMMFALNEALELILEEGLDARIARHTLNHRAFRAGAEAMGLEYIPQNSLTVLNAIFIPEGIDDALIRRRLLQEYGIEIGAGFGPFKGKAWRIGLMGESSTRRNVMLLLAALETMLADQGYTLERGAACASAAAVYESPLVESAE